MRNTKSQCIVTAVSVQSQHQTWLIVAIILELLGSHCNHVCAQRTWKQRFTVWPKQSHSNSYSFTHLLLSLNIRFKCYSGIRVEIKKLKKKTFSQINSLRFSTNFLTNHLIQKKKKLVFVTNKWFVKFKNSLSLPSKVKTRWMVYEVHSRVMNGLLDGIDSQLLIMYIQQR